VLGARRGPPAAADPAPVQRNALRAGAAAARRVRDGADEGALAVWCDDGGRDVRESPEPHGATGETPNAWFFLYWA